MTTEYRLVVVRNGRTSRYRKRSLSAAIADAAPYLLLIDENRLGYERVEIEAREISKWTRVDTAEVTE